MGRRGFLERGRAIIEGVLGADDADLDDDGRRWVMPEEGQPHTRTWMAFGATERVWGRGLLPHVQRDLAGIANAIAMFEPVSMLVRAEDMVLARSLVGPRVELVEAVLDDIWMRDTGPVFVRGETGRGGADFNFNGWGGKQSHRRDSAVAGQVSTLAGVEALETDLVLESGGVEVDGEGTAIITESCVLNRNRNPGWKRHEVEEELAYLLGIEKVIWLPGLASYDITDGHTDFYARFAHPGVVVAGYDRDPSSPDHQVMVRHLEILRTATDARGRPLRVEVIAGPVAVRPRYACADFAAGYINFYLCNGAVVAPEFGDPAADTTARDTLARLFPNRRIVQLDIDAIAAGGGGIHCTTQQEPAH